MTLVEKFIKKAQEKLVDFFNLEDEHIKRKKER